MTETMHTYMPVFIQVRELPVLIVGGGEVALRKAEMLAGAGAEIHIIAPEIHAALAALPGVHCEARLVADEDITNAYRLVILATDQPAVQERMSRICRRLGILCNRCDLPGDGDFVTGSVVKRGPILAAVTASGVPAMARLVRERFEKTIEPALVELAGLLEEVRPRLKERRCSPDRRADFFRRWACEEAVDEIRRRGVDSVREEMMRCLS